ncbi:MAG TPA: hypothetical protein VF752_09995 [Thermoleophilaceae bacterium]
MGMKPIAGAVAGVVVAAVAGVAIATPGTSDGVTWDAKTTTPKVNTPTGLSTTIKGAPVGADGKQVPIRKVTVQFPPGTKINTKALPQCTASPQTIQNTNGNVCSKSRVGTGLVKANTGLGEGVDPLSEDVQAFNGKKKIFFLLTPKGAVGQTAVLTGTFSGTTAPKLVVDVPLFPIPGGSNAVLIQFDFAVKKTGTGKRAYGTTPKTCPKSGKWKLPATFGYEGHADIHVTATGPCRR